MTRLPKSHSFNVEDHPRPGVTLSVRLALRDGVYLVTSSLLAGTSITPRDMTRTRLAEQVRSELQTFILAPRLTGDRLRDVRAIYIYETETWGNPRRAVIDHLGVSRTTANRLIRDAFAVV